VAPAATPRDVVERLNKAFVAALQAPETKTRFAQLMAEPVGNTPEQFGAFMYQVFHKNGERHSAAKAYITPHL
jgi:tripartite-type tricarboxylate transporter receptor subunit TctC